MTFQGGQVNGALAIATIAAICTVGFGASWTPAGADEKHRLTDQATLGRERQEQAESARKEDSPSRSTAPSAGPQPSEPSRLPVERGEIPDFAAETPQTGADTSGALGSSLFQRALSDWIVRVFPNQGGSLWLGVLLTVLIAADIQRPWSRRNLDLLLLLALSLFLIDIVRFATGLEDPTKFTLAGIVFSCVFLYTLLLLTRALIGTFRKPAQAWRPNLSKAALRSILALLLLLTTFLALARAPDDAGYYTNIGAHRMLQTGKFPYADPDLAGGSAATYGPLLYLAHIPFQVVLKLPTGLSGDAAEDRSPHSDPSLRGLSSRPPQLATTLTLLAFHLLGVLALLSIGTQLGGQTIGLALACLYIGSPYVQGLGGEEFFITGMTFISHIAPAALTLLAFSTLGKPVLAGVLLACSAGLMFYPAFFFPVWLGHYFWRREGWLRFALAFVATALLIFLLVLLLTHSSDEQTRLEAIYDSTVGHQEARDTYGASSFSFWGTHPTLTDFWQKPLISGQHLVRPSTLLFALFLSAGFIVARGRNKTQLAFLTAGVALAIQLWKSHAGGTYVEWYYPFLLIGLLCSESRGGVNGKGEPSNRSHLETSLLSCE